MKNLFTCLSKKSLSNGNGPMMDRQCTGDKPAISGKLFASILFLLLLFGVGNAWGTPTTIYYETFKKNSGSKTADFSSTYAYDANSTTIISTSWKVSKYETSPSDYDGASGESHLATSTSDATLVFSFGNKSSYSSVVLSFGWKNDAGKGKNRTITCVISGDGGETWSSDILPQHNESEAADCQKWFYTTYNVPAASLSNLKVKFTNTASNTSRVDDVKLTGTAAATYSVTYNLNGGSETTPTETNKASGATFTLHNGTSSITAPTGKSFIKWKDQDDNLYSGGDTYTMPAKNVTLTAQWSCITPTISGHPAAATYWDMDSPSALTVTASGGTLSYQWQMSADGSSSWSNVGTNSSSYTPSVANGTKYYRCIVTNTGSSCNTTATSNNALVTIKTLSSIAVKTSPKTTYFAGETFSPTNLVITLTASDASTQDRSYASYSSGFTFSPTTATVLTTSDDKVTITYGGETVDQAINVYSVTVNKVNMSGTAISNASVTASCSGRTLSQSVGSTNYKFNTYAVTAGGVGISGSTITGTPTGDVTINAKFHDPITVTWKVGTGAASGSPTGEVKYGTAITALPSTPADNALASCGTNKFMGWSASELTGTGHSAPADLFTTVGGAANLTTNTTYRAVFANQTSGYVNTTVVEDFEKQGTSTTYNSTQTYGQASSNASIGWVMYYGTNSTDVILEGSRSAQMRWYSTATSNYPYIKDTTQLLSLSKLKFRARVSNTNVKMDVSYSTNNGSSWTKVADGATMTTSEKEYSYDIPGASATKYIIQIGVNSSSTAPSSGNYKFTVDSVAFTYKVPGTVTSDYQTGCCTAPGTALSITSANSKVTGGTVSLTSTGGNGGTVTWSVVNGTGSATISDGVLTAGDVGTVTVKAHQNANTVLGVEYCAQDAEQAFTVVSATVNVTGVEVSPTSKAIVPGETFDITPTISPSNATDKSVSWSSSASDKASVSSGTVTGVAAGTANITCTTTDGSYTATTAVTVYAVTMQALDEDGNAIAVGGPSTPSRTGASISPAADAGNYVFKEWAISGASLGSSASTKANTITNPTGAVTVTAKYYKPRVVKWSVKGDNTYDEGSPTLTVAYNSAISAVPDAPDDDALNNCANKFMGWSTKNFGSTPKTTASGQYDDLFTSASGYTTGITDATTTFYAVYAELTPSITSWSAGSYYMIDTYNDHYYALTGDVSSGAVSATDVTDAVTYDSELGTIALNPSHSSVLSTMVYTLSLSEGVYSITTSTSGCIKSSTGAGLTGCGGTNVWNQLDKDDADATRRFGFVCSGESRTILYNSTNGFKNFATSNKGGSGYGTGYFYLVPQTAATNYVTQCASTQVRVNYAGNGGSAPSCSSGVTTKSDSYTICSTEPTKSYYDFDGWSDGTNTYDAGASYNLQANTTFTAQWSPTEYDITYELDGGTNDGDNPATYTIEDEDIVLGEPTKDHYRFDGWYQTYSAGVFSNPITTISSGSHGNITIYAKWVAAYVITWDNPMGASVASTMVDEGSALGDLPVPSGTCTIGGVTYSNFVGWYTGTISGIADAVSDAGTLVTSATIPTGDATYHAVYTNKPDYSSTHTSNIPLPTSDPTNSSLTHIKVSSSDGVPSYQAVKMGTNGSKTGNSFTITVPIGTTSLVLHGVGWKNQTANVLISGADGVSIDPDEKQQLTAHGSATGTIDGTTTTVFATHDTETFSISGIDAAAKQTITITQVDERIIIWGINAVVPSGSTAKYITKCCSNLVTLNGGSPTNGSVTFSPSGPIGTCDEDAKVTMTITPTSGYQLATFSVATGDGKVATKSMSADVVLNNNSSSAQEIDLTFAEDAVGSYDVTATFTEKTVTGWTFTNHAGGATITDEPIEIYVNQRLRADIAYSPTPLVSSHTSSTSYNYSPYPWSHDYLKSPNKAGDYFTIDGKASTNGETTSVTLTHNDGPTKTIYLKVLPLPVDHYLDLVHGVAFDDQSATTSDGVVTLTYTAPGSDQDEWDDEYANTCEQKKVKLVGWVESEYADACIAADSFPTTDALKADSEHFFEVGATMTASNKTYYAVWAEKE